MRIISRIEQGLPARVTKLNHVTLRPLLPKMLGLVVFHYTGVNRKYRGLDQAAVTRIIAAIHRWRANEYNWVIDQSGRIYEFAGEHEGAHCKGYNHRSVGVLFLNGVGEPLTPEQLDAWHWLRGCLQWVQQINLTPFQVPHQWLGATACPGEIMSALPQLQAAA